MLVARRLVLILCCVPLMSAQTASDPEAFWKEFLAWYKAQPFELAAPSAVTQKYAAHLRVAGKTEAEVQARMAAIDQIAPGHPEAIGAFFDKIYGGEVKLFTPKPNAFLTQIVEGRKPGAALDVAMGEGRNSVYLAQHGWKVTGFDVSERGLAVAREHARQAGVEIETVLTDKFDYGSERWDLIVLCYPAGAAPLEDAQFIRRLHDALRPGGVVVLESFLAPPGIKGAKGPANAWPIMFADFRIIYYEDREDIPDWFLKPSRVGRLAAEREK